MKTRKQIRSQRRIAASIVGASLVGGGVIAYTAGMFAPDTAPYVAIEQQYVAPHFEGEPEPQTAVGGGGASMHAVAAEPPVDSAQGGVAGAGGARVADVASDSTGRFVVESVGLDVTLDEMEFSSVIRPPTYLSAFEVVDPDAGWLGTSEHVRLIAMHSSSSVSHSPGNALVQGGESTLSVGDTFEVDGATFEVKSTEIVRKDQVPAETYSNSPGKLVVITCSPENGIARSTSNLVLIAQEVEGDA